MASLKDVREILGDVVSTNDAIKTNSAVKPTINNSTSANFQLALPQVKFARARGGLGADGGEAGGNVNESTGGQSAEPLYQHQTTAQAGPSSSQAQQQTQTRTFAPPKRSLKQSSGAAPTISRELYALIGDSAPSLRLVREELGIGRGADGDVGVGGGVGGRQWGKAKGKAGNVKWVLQEFTPPHHPSLDPPPIPSLARPPNPQPPKPFILRHYRPSSSLTGGIVQGSSSAAQDEWTKNLAAFGRDGEGRGVMEYTGWEYERWLGDPSWTPLETAYLFSLLRAYDLRFLVVADRYAYLPPGGSDPSSQALANGMPIWPPPSVMNKQKDRAEGRRKSTRGKGQDGEQDADAETNKDVQAQPILTTAATIAQARERRATRSIANLKDVSAVGGGEGSGAASPARGSRHGTPAETQKEKARAEKKKQADKIVKSDVKLRTLEEIKHRYYWICRKLIEKRPAADEAVRQRHMKMYDFDYDREVARKKAANALFHLNKSEIQEQEALYVELKKMEQNERRYKIEREELMRRMAGLESGIFKPGKIGEGNSAFGDGKVAGIGMARGADGVMVPQDKTKKRKRGDDGEPAAAAEPEPAPTAKKRQDPLFDERNNIYRIPMARDLPARALHQPAHLRSTKLPVPRTGGTSQKVYDLMTEMGITAGRLIMPTRVNVDKLDGLMNATQDLVDMKRQFDRMEQEVKALRLLASGGSAPVMPAIASAVPVAIQAVAPQLVREQRSQSVLSNTTSDAPSRKKK